MHNLHDKIKRRAMFSFSKTFLFTSKIGRYVRWAGGGVGMGLSPTPPGRKNNSKLFVSVKFLSSCKA